jgi:hypothetical protein
MTEEQRKMDTEEIISKIDSFMDKRGELDLESKEAVVKIMAERYWEERKLTFDIFSEEDEDDFDDFSEEDENLIDEENDIPEAALEEDETSKIQEEERLERENNEENESNYIVPNSPTISRPKIAIKKEKSSEKKIDEGEY